MAQGFTVDHDDLAVRIGELKALADSVENAAGLLACGGHLGPGDLDAAVREVSEQWVDGIGSMRDKLNDMAGNLDNVVGNYRTLEQGGEQRMQALADGIVTNVQLGALRGAAARQLAQQNALRRQLQGGKP